MAARIINLLGGDQVYNKDAMDSIIESIETGGFQFTTMPDASENNGKCYQYTGVSNGTYEQGTFYLSNGTVWTAVTDLPQFAVIAELPSWASADSGKVYFVPQADGTALGFIKASTTDTWYRLNKDSPYIVKGSAVYADTAYLDDPAHEQDIDSVGLWQDVSGTWTKITNYEPGWVYNILNDFTTDSNFIEGVGVPVAAGTNVMVADESGVPKLDVFSASINLEPYQTKALIQPLTKYANDCAPTVYTTYTDLPSTVDVSIESWAIPFATVIIGGSSAETGNVWQITDISDPGLAITWSKIGNQTTVEGALQVLANGREAGGGTVNEIDSTELSSIIAVFY